MPGLSGRRSTTKAVLVAVTGAVLTATCPVEVDTPPNCATLTDWLAANATLSGVVRFGWSVAITNRGVLADLLPELVSTVVGQLVVLTALVVPGVVWSMPTLPMMAEPAAIGLRIAPITGLCGNSVTNGVTLPEPVMTALNLMRTA